MRALSFRAFLAFLTALCVVSAGYRAEAPHVVVVALARVAHAPEIREAVHAEVAPALRARPRPVEVAKAPRRLPDPRGRVADAPFARTAARYASPTLHLAVASAGLSAPMRIDPPGRSRARLMVFVI